LGGFFFGEMMTTQVNGSNGYSKLYMACTVVLSITGLFGWIILNNQSSKDAEQNERIETLEKTKTSKDLSSEKFRIVEKELDTLESKFKALDEKIVPRGEHTEKWKANDQAFLNIQKQIDDIRKDVGSTYSLGDKIKEMQEQINRLLQLDKPKTEK
jgi:uncharacterized coiled-coil protein SlyX